MSATFVGFGFGPIQTGLLLFEAVAVGRLRPLRRRGGRPGARGRRPRGRRRGRDQHRRERTGSAGAASCRVELSQPARSPGTASCPHRRHRRMPTSWARRSRAWTCTPRAETRRSRPCWREGCRHGAAAASSTRRRTTTSRPRSSGSRSARCARRVRPARPAVPEHRGREDERRDLLRRGDETARARAPGARDSTSACSWRSSTGS